MRTRLVVALLFFAGLAFAQDQSKSTGLTIEQIMSAPYPNNLTAARTGGRIAWVFNKEGERNIWVADAPGFAARQVTHYQGDDGQPIAALTLTADGKTAVYARGTETNERGYSANPESLTGGVKQQVFAVDLDTPNAQPRLLGDMGCPEEDCEDIQISPDGKQAVWAAKKHLWMAPLDAHEKARQLFDVQGNNIQPKWSPDGKELAFVSDRGDHSLIGIYSDGARAVRYLAPTTDRDMFPRWSPDGKQLAFVRLHGNPSGQPLIPVRPEPWKIMVADAATGTAQEVWHSGDRLTDSLPGLTEDDSFFFAADGRIVFASEQDDRNHLYSVPASGGAAVLLTPGDFDVEYVDMNTPRTEIVYSSNQDDIELRHIWQVSPSGGEKPRQLSAGPGMENRPHFTGDGANVVCVGSSATSPLMPYSLAGGKRTMIAADQFPKDYPSDQLVTPKVVTFKSEDGLTIHGQLFVPKNVKPGAKGMIFVHGGSMRQMMPAFHYMLYYHQSYAQNQWLASQGYVVLSVNYRTGIMYGRAFREAPQTGWRGSAEYKDVVAGAKYLQSLPYVDKDRIGIWGGSYGGLLTALALSRNSDIFKAGVDYHGVHDWSAFLPEWEQNVNSAPDLQAARALAFQSSPAAAAKSWRSPVLFIHGDDDRNVPFNQTTQMRELIRPNNVHVEELIFPDEIHDMLRWHDWVKTYKAGADFFARELK